MTDKTLREAIESYRNHIDRNGLQAPQCLIDAEAALAAHTEGELTTNELPVETELVVEPVVWLWRRKSLASKGADAWTHSPYKPEWALKEWGEDVELRPLCDLYTSGAEVSRDDGHGHVWLCGRCGRDFCALCGGTHADPKNNECPDGWHTQPHYVPEVSEEMVEWAAEVLDEVGGGVTISTEKWEDTIRRALQAALQKGEGC